MSRSMWVHSSQLDVLEVAYALCKRGDHNVGPIVLRFSVTRAGKDEEVFGLYHTS